MLRIHLILITICTVCSLARSQELGKVMDFTVLENGTMSIIYEPFYDSLRKQNIGFLQAYDKKSRPLYEEVYRLKAAYESSFVSGYAIGMAKNHTLFYGQKGTTDSLYYLLVNKRGDILKQVEKAVDFREIIAKTDASGFRSLGYFYLVAFQYKEKISAYFAASKTLHAQIFLRDISQENRKVHFDTFEIISSDSTSTISYGDELRRVWEHEIKGILPSSQEKYKLIETDDAFYFVLKNTEENAVPSLVYVVEKTTGLVRQKLIPARFGA